ncbi:MAG: futalosine hydrolase [Candidatus Pristimantibacillus sp.]
MNPDRRILIMTAVAAEKDAVLRGLKGDPRFDVFEAGVGPFEAGVRTATVLASADADRYSLVISAGIAGGFVDRAEIGSIVISSEIIAADLGAETSDGFRSVDELGFGSAYIEVNTTLASRLMEALQHANLPVALGPVLTLSTVTGTAETAEQLAQRIPGAAAEAMEGFGVAAAARYHQLPVLEIRTISNQVGPRDRDAWRIKEALQALEAASSVLLEVI